MLPVSSFSFLLHAAPDRAQLLVPLSLLLSCNTLVADTFTSGSDVLQDEKKERDTFQQHKTPRLTGPSAAADASRARTPRVSSGTGSTAGTAPAAATGADAAAGAQPSPSKDGTGSPRAAAAKGAGPEQPSSSTAVQAQVDSFNTIISEEAASAATLPADLGGSKQASGEFVVRHGAGFRVVRPAGVPDPHADAAADDGSTTATAAAAAAGGGGGVDAATGQQQQQSVALLRQDFASRAKVRRD